MKRITIYAFFVVFAIAFMTSCGTGGGNAVSAQDIYTESSDTVAYPLTDGNIAAVLIKTQKTFSGFEAVVSTDGSEKLKALLTVYKFETDYRSTIESGDKVIKETYENIKDGEKLYLQTKPMDAGSYLLTISSDTPGVSIKRHAFVPALENKAAFYYSGVQIQTGAFPFKILFSEKDMKELTVADLLLSVSGEQATEPDTEAETESTAAPDESTTPDNKDSAD